ncbi:MAG: lipid IV(A) 3-deoxy-D-manno-octulosonic acid transferase [Halomonas sp.]|uniref:lipid IV(A) 3-deoxy-D-manno-octulosonic acid transferase n=1 Tax=Halomonas sp. TaxID=1486246 RepID=UPI002ACE8DF9|nr:lipid IV(A) 3-deoxy-D-manno-octulosonic acid transferase [Halomonas sp.]MDZ7851447.1 lipid IV(A) 3-deoxy-D-manno-octulosonic acid transferase [Halomonas sp.]
MSTPHPWVRRGYATALYLIAPLIWRRVWREQLPGRSRRERLGFIPSTGKGGRTLWLHCASVGEVQAARPLIEALCERWPGHRLVITTMTATGAERVLALAESGVKSRDRGEVSHHFVPLDFPGAARRFVSRLRPELAIFFETELWPNLLAACDRSGVPVAVVNGRLSARAWRGYRRVRPLMQEALSHVAWLAAKSEADAQRFIELGMAGERTTVVGSLKFDIGTKGEAEEVSKRLRTRLGNRPVWVAGSTHPGEDEQVLAAHARLLERLPGALLVLVPRHPRRFDAVASLCRQAGLTLARRSRDEWPGDDTAVYLGDTMGDLLALYGASDLAFVGGSLVPIGGHNLLEPAALGIPVLTGPALANFEDVAEVMREAGALVEVTDAEALAKALVRLLGDDVECNRLVEAGTRMMASNRGALERTLTIIKRFLP